MMTLAKSVSWSTLLAQQLAGRVDRLRRRVQQRRQRALFQHAVAQAYRHFAVQHPRWVDSLFDRHFLTTHADCLLAPVYTHKRWPTAYELAAVYLAHLEDRDKAENSARLEKVIPVASDFLSHLEREWPVRALPTDEATASTACPVQIRIALPPKQPHIALVEVKGELNRHTYMFLIEAAVKAYAQGPRCLLIDLRGLTQIELSGLFALHSIARFYAGELLLDPEGGWVGMRGSAEQITPGMEQWVKLMAPPPAVALVIQSSGLSCFFELFNDVDAALAGFPDPNTGR